jgi:hypothetical protein
MERLREELGSWVATLVVCSAAVALGLSIVAVLLGPTNYLGSRQNQTPVPTRRLHPLPDSMGNRSALPRNVQCGGAHHQVKPAALDILLRGLL